MDSLNRHLCVLTYDCRSHWPVLYVEIGPPTSNNIKHKMADATTIWVEMLVITLSHMI